MMAFSHHNLKATSATPRSEIYIRVLQTIQKKLVILCVWAEPAILGSAKTTLKLKYEI